ncbi:MAG: glycosyltransferase family 39 protein [Cyanobacteria bacterium P01_A01_bin.17]
MSARTSNTNVRIAGLGLLIAITVLFIGLRLVNIEADFPSGMTFSTALYTDEGWHLSGAVNLIVTGQWYVRGDFNPAVNLPVGHLIQAATFSTFGMSLASARATVVVCFALLVALVFMLSRKYAGLLAAVFASFFLSVNFFAFAYSRLAILEILMSIFVMLALWTVSSLPQKNNLGVIVLSSLVLVVAMLTKSTAISTLPAFMYLSSARGKGLREKALFAAVAAVLFAVALSLYNLLASQAYYEDFYYFKNLALDDRFSPSLLDMVQNFGVAILKARRIEPLIYFFTVLSSLFLCFRVPDYRKNLLVQTAALWMLSYFGVLSVTSYHPSRYFLPLIIPVSMLFGIVVASLQKLLGQRSAVFAQVLLVAFILVANGYRIVDYVSTPKFTFLEMAQDVRDIMQADGAPDSLLLGNFASTVSLATGVPFTNTALSTQTVAEKLETLDPQFYLSLGQEPDVVSALSEGYELQPMSEWDVFDNYRNGDKVHLFKLSRKGAAG